MINIKDAVKCAVAELARFSLLFIQLRPTTAVPALAARQHDGEKGSPAIVQHFPEFAAHIAYTVHLAGPQRSEPRLLYNLPLYYALHFPAIVLRPCITPSHALPALALSA